MSFKRKTKGTKKANTITLTKLTSGNSQEFHFNPAEGPRGNLARFLKEHDDEGYPLFFAEAKIAGLPVRVRDADIESRMAYYLGENEKGSLAAKRAPAPAKIAVAAEKITKAVKKATNKKAAGAAKKAAKKTPAKDGE
tara:strand:- start:241 stop:654 length:414 start_codon:yes stop_codon:yes gene_type:complete